MIFGRVLPGHRSPGPCGPLGRRPSGAADLGHATRPGLSSEECSRPPVGLRTWLFASALVPNRRAVPTPPPDVMLALDEHERRENRDSRFDGVVVPLALVHLARAAAARRDRAGVSGDLLNPIVGAVDVRPRRTRACKQVYEASQRAQRVRSGVGLHEARRLLRLVRSDLRRRLVSVGTKTPQSQIASEGKISRSWRATALEPGRNMAKSMLTDR